jgi:hypothetical protein|tara:strand:- start:851 stop:1972 length:1122 start_codon:yes stop_codon:yes gene_type:complete
MPSFKPRAKKKLSKKGQNILTVDNQHNEKMKHFQTIEENSIPKLEERKQKILAKLKKTNNNDIETTLKMQDELGIIKKQIRDYKDEKRKYLLNNVELVFQYFEKKKELSGGGTKAKILHSFFDKYVSQSKDTSTDINTIQQYFTNIDDKYIDIDNYKISQEECKRCNGELIAVETEGVKICNKCSVRIPYIIVHEKPSFKEPPKEVCFYAYKRINHFREILAQFQAKETTQIPEEVLTNIISQIKKERTSITELTNKRAKEILKKLGYNKYYEHIPFIKEKLGIKPPIMSTELEDKLCSLFMDIQRPYATHCPDDRVNFLNYYYVLYKICELLGEVSFLPFFPMLKDPVKRIEQDEIWKKICAELKWEYIPTI